MECYNKRFWVANFDKQQYNSLDCVTCLDGVTMIVECTKCKAKYKISDEKLAAKDGPVKLKCKKCGATITVGGHSDEQRQWYIADNGQRKGPFSDEEMLKQAGDGQINDTSFVWTKGFSNWQRAGDIEFFNSIFKKNNDDSEETQLLDSNEIQHLTGEFSANGKKKDGSGDEGLVWQRNETSVLFSLDDYSPGMKTITRGQAVIDLGEDEPQDVPKDVDVKDEPAAGDMDVISLDEQDVANVKKVLDASQKRRKTMYITIGGVVVIAIVLVAFLFMNNSSKSEKVVLAKPHNIEKQQKISMVKKPTKPVKHRKSPIVTKKTVSDAVIKKEVKEPLKKAVLKKGVVKKKVASVKKKHKKKVRKKKHVSKHVSKKVVIKKAKPAKHEGDAQSILNSLRTGKKNQQEKHVAAVDESSLPRTLPTAVINRVMRRVRPKVKKCLDKAGIDNEGQLVIMSRLKIAGKGYVQSVHLSGRVGGARSCITKVLKSIHFSRFRDPSMPVSYPYVF